MQRVSVLLITLSLALTAHAGQDRETLYQVSTIDALLTGVYEPLAKVGDILAHGTFGLGTFTALDGELILLDGKVYQASADGAVHVRSPAAGTPFIAVTFFDADQTHALPPGQNYADFKTWLESRLESRNLPYAVRVDGTFDQITYRSMPRQEKPYQPLAAVARQQKVFSQQAVTGTLIGFWCPTFTRGVNVPGFHLHFLSADRRHGGHVLDFNLQEGRAQLDETSGWEVQLPRDPAFLRANLNADREDALRAVEQGQPKR